MKRYIAYVFAFTIITTAALAQSIFVPLTVTEQDAKNLRQYLDEQPMKFSLPILQWIDALEQRAVKDKAEAEKKD